MVLELVGGDGLLLRRDAIAMGYDDNALARVVRDGSLTRIRQGAYAATPLWASLDPVERHRRLSAAVMRQYGQHVALSHTSALLVHRGPVYRLDLDNVHLTHFRGGGRASAGVVHHEGACRVDDVTRIAGHWITSPTRTFLDMTTLASLATAVAIGDDFTRRGLTSVPHLQLAYPAVAHWPQTLNTALAISLIDPRSESLGESLNRMMFRQLGLPAPELQYEVRHPDGRLAGRADFAWPHLRVFGEFDGEEKYHRLRLPNESIEAMVMREKHREDLFRELTGFAMIRYVFGDLYVPTQLRDRTLAVFAQALRAA